MLFMKMDLLNYQYLDKMNNNIGVLCYEGRCCRVDFLFVSVTATPPRWGDSDRLASEHFLVFLGMVECLDKVVHHFRTVCWCLAGGWQQGGPEGTYCCKFVSNLLTRSDRIVTL